MPMTGKTKRVPMSGYAMKAVEQPDCSTSNHGTIVDTMRGNLMGGFWDGSTTGTHNSFDEPESYGGPVNPEC
jgi:hypothetical protein